MVVKFEGVKDVASKVNKLAYNTYSKAKSAYDYYSGKSNSRYDFSSKASIKDIKSTPVGDDIDSFTSDKFTAKIDKPRKVVELRFKASDAPLEFAKKVMPGQPLYNYVSTYDEDSDEVVMILPQMTSPFREEGVMTPVPIPYQKSVNTESAKDSQEDSSRYDKILTKDVLDSDGFITDYTLYYDTKLDKYFTIFGDTDIYLPEDTEPDFETDSQEDAIEWFNSYKGAGEEDISEYFDEYSEESLEEDATQSSNIGQHKSDSIDLIPHKDEEESSLDEGLMFTSDKVFDIDSYRDSDNLKDVINKVAKKGDTFATKVKSLLFKILEYLQSLGLNPNFDKIDDTYYIKYVPLTEGKNLFKSNHICQGCGNTLDKCTCEVSEESLED